jgi:amino acid adenylation domain-containing protein
VARGYYGKPGLTSERFLPNPFSGGKNGRLYKTGDLCRWLPDGNMQYLGRMDHQVKVRGFRVEVGEIEAALEKHPAVRQSVVMGREDEPGLKRLVAYVVAKSGASPQPEELRGHVQQSLPDYMVPAAVVVLEAFPLTPNGKVNRKALPAPEYRRDEREAYVAPRTPVEEGVAGIWSEVLRVPRLGVQDNFFAAGGHSLLATQVISRMRQMFGVELPVRAMFEAPTVAGLAGRIEAALSAEHHLELPPLTRVARGARMPLSFAQQRLWFLDQLDPGNPLYNIPCTLRADFALDLAALERSLNALVERHETLRTTFVASDGQPALKIAPVARVAVPVVDLRHLPQPLREQECQRVISEEARLPFDLLRGPLLRAKVLRVDSEIYMVLMNIHHIISDRWSMGVFLEELSSLYGAFSEGKTPSLPELPVQYADFSVWQRELLQGQVYDRQLAYWKEQLQGAPAVLELPTDRPRPAVESFRGEVATLVLPEQLTEKLNELSRAEGVTLFMTLLAAFQALLGRYSGQEDVVVGMPIASRNHPEIEGLIGFFLNTLPIRTRLSGNPSFQDLLARVKETALGAYANEDMPFEKLVEELQPERSLSHSPLVQVFFILQNAPLETMQFKGLPIRRIETETKTSKGDLFFSLAEKSGELRGRMEYSTDLFDAATIGRMLGHYRTLLEAAVANPARPLSELPLLTSGERQQILVEWNATKSEYPRDRCLHDLFAEVARRNADRVAVVGHDQSLTYGELHARSSQLARYLRKRRVGPGVLVGLCIERSAEMLVALMGILKSGAAYVPLDPNYPKDRIAFIVEDSQTPVLLTQQSLVDLVSRQSAQVIKLDTDWEEIARESAADMVSPTTAESLAYVLYTSGSTGKPKGVQIQHRSLVNFLVSMQRKPGLSNEDTLLAVTTLSFDIAGLELYLPLVTGAKVVLASGEQASDGKQLLSLLQKSKATVLQATPASWRMLIDAGWTGTPGLKALCGGEALPKELAAQILPRCEQLWNMYGPTETTIWSSVFRVEPELRVTTPIGRPIANTTMHVLDSHFQPVPAGVTGELFIGGDGVACGYLNRPELTAEKFIPDPFGSAGARLYRTGDLSRYLRDGNLEFLGRSDFQVKVRGFRIELGEIESVLAQHAAVRQNVVVAREDQPGNGRLIAYIVPAPGQDPVAGELRAHVKRSLPEYMVPSLYIKLESMPLTPNGKVNRNALPAPEPATASREDYVAPRTAVEEVLAGIWAEVLKVDRVGMQSDFFELGGHSLLATQVVARIREAFSVDLPLRAIFEIPTVAAQAERVEQLRRQDSEPVAPLVRIERNGKAPLSFAQQRLWFLDQLEPFNPLYNVPYIVRLQGAMDVPALEDSLNEIVRRHESLRTRFAEVEGEPLQIVEGWRKLPLAVMDVSGLAPQAGLVEARRLAMNEAKRPFDLSTAPLMRALLIKLADDDHALVLNTHHIITDRWSWGVLSQELAVLYEAFVAGKASPLEDLSLQYGDYAIWQRAHMAGGRMDRQLAYWKQQLEGAPAVLELPTDRPRRAMENFWGGVHSKPVPEDLANDLRALSRGHGGTLFMTLLAGFQALLGRLSGQEDVVVGTDLANRTQFATEKLIGFFVNLLPIRTRLGGDPKFTELLARVRESSLGAFANQDAPFEELVKELQPERNLNHHPLVQVLFVMQNTPQGPREFGGLKAGPLGVSSTSRFDLVLFINNPEATPLTTWMYNPNLFDASTIARMADLYEQLLRSVAEQPEAQLSRINDALDEGEHRWHEAEQKAFQETSLRKLKGVRRRTPLVPVDGDSDQA